MSEVGPVINAIANLLGCAPYQLRRRLAKPENMDKVHEYLKDKTIRTTHLGVRNRVIPFHHLTLQGANSVPAYGGYLGVNVQQHFYARHRIRLRYACLPCIAVETYSKKKKKNRYSFFPLEVCSIEDDSDMVFFW